MSKGFSLTLNGPAPPPSSTISGVVDDVTTGQPVSNALVNLQDSANHSYLTRSSSSGKFSFTAGGSTPVVAGAVVIGASKKGYQDFTGTPRTFTPGQNLTGWRVLIKPVAVAPSASASALGHTVQRGPNTERWPVRGAERLRRRGHSAGQHDRRR